MDQICSRQISKFLVALLSLGLVTGVARAQAPTPSAANPSPAVTPAPAPGKAAEPSVATPEPGDRVVLKVGDLQFTKADIDFLVVTLGPQAQRAVATQGKKSLGDQFALLVMLSQQAQAHHLDDTPAFVQKLAIQKRQMEAQAAYEEINQEAKVSPQEINQYYNTHTSDYDEITVRQFVIRKKAAEAKADPAHPAASSGSGLAPEEAKTRAEAIRKELTAGTDIKKVIEDFKAPGDVIIDPEPRKVRHGSMRPEMEKVAFALKDGEISDPLDVPQALVFFQVTGHNHVDVKDATPEIEKRLQREKVEAALADIKKGNTVWMDEQYFAAPLKPAERPTLGGPVVPAPPKP